MPFALECSPDQPITAVLTEWSIQVDRDTVRAGTIRFRVRNNGEHDHALAVEGAGVERRTEDIPSGEWAVLDLELGPGTYDVYCPLDAHAGSDHAERGMRTRLTLIAGPPR